ncbi:hypothetical protein HGD85_01675 [Rhodobacteraceae bacterium R_SAG10]|nr:hypothetical protein [Rhodobacteraceae bacterium R_SAG10]
MKLVSYNIRFGLGTDQKIDLVRVADIVKDADIIALQEVERYWRRSGMTDQPEIISSHMKEYHWLYFPAFDVDASKSNGDASIVNRRRQFGPMILSRWPIRMARYILFPKLGTTDCYNMDTGAIECIIETPAGPLMVYSLHLSAVSGRNRLMQIDRLLEFYRGAPVSGGSWTGGFATMENPARDLLTVQNWSNGEAAPVIPKEAVVMGDFNFVPDSEEYNRMVGTPDTWLGRIAHFDSFMDSWTIAKERIGERNSWYPDPPERDPDGPACLDYCFVSPFLSQNVERVWVDHKASGSDHRPYWVELNTDREPSNVT